MLLQLLLLAFSTEKSLQTYDSPVYPVILMPPVIHPEQVTMPLNEVGCFIGPNVHIDNGPREHVMKALSLIQSAIHKPGESSVAEKEIDELFKKLQCGESSDEQVSLKKGRSCFKMLLVLLKPTYMLQDASEDDYRKTQHLAGAVAARAKTSGKLYRIRNKELYKVLGEDHKHFELIH